MIITNEKQSIIRNILSEVVDPCSVAMGVPLNVLDMGLLKNIEEKENGEVAIHLRITSPMCTMVSYFIKEIEERTNEFPGIGNVICVVDNGIEWEPGMMTKEAVQKRMDYLHSLDRKMSRKIT
ncbi:metal-sulfur cluster assembly factor [Bacillus sp. M6-12]|uniref:metal-sulfur cluster assembly factor n=1 Tax=Bacillus sp. M6-12 TaxID=2054166 RepID=UPI0015E1158B|nr:iron-sulfur cluster assembly protein [Bacillus sp. M6-12]